MSNNKQLEQDYNTSNRLESIDRIGSFDNRFYKTWTTWQRLSSRRWWRYFIDRIKSMLFDREVIYWMERPSEEIEDPYIEEEEE